MPNFIINIWQAFAGGHLRALLRIGAALRRLPVARQTYELVAM